MTDKWQEARLIRASEVGDYVYCNQQWWLKRVRGIRSAKVARMTAGTVYHEEHADQLETLNRRQVIVSVLVGLALMGFLLWMIMQFGGTV